MHPPIHTALLDDRGGATAPLMAALAVPVVLLIGGLLSITLVFGAAPPGCGGSETGAVNGKVPARLAPIYVAAASRYGLGAKGPAVLAAINEIETGFGRLNTVSSAGAEGWMQFMPETWDAYGVDANGDGVRDPYDPEDAIFAAANYLRASGAPGDWHDAIYSYNHAEWYVEKVERAAERFAGGETLATSTACSPAGSAAEIAGEAVRLYEPRAFKALPSRLWIGSGSPQAVDARIWPNAVWLLEAFDLRVTAARESGHQTHGDGTALDMVPAAGRGWDGTALQAAETLGWISSCGGSGSAPVCPLVPAIQWVGYNGYENHGDPAHVGSNAHLHVSWRSSEYGCPGLCEPREWVEVFLWQE